MGDTKSTNETGRAGKFYDYRYRNIDALLRGYRGFKANALHSIANFEEIEQQMPPSLIKKLIRQPFFNPDYKLDSLAEWREFSLIVIAQVEGQMARWARSGNKTARFRWAIIDGMYIGNNRRKLTDIAAEFNKNMAAATVELRLAKQEIADRILGLGAFTDGYSLLTYKPETENSSGNITP